MIRSSTLSSLVELIVGLIMAYDGRSGNIMSHSERKFVRYDYMLWSEKRSNGSVVGPFLTKNMWVHR